MSKPRYRWWGYVKAVIRAYPELKRIAELPAQTSVTARYGPQAPKSGAGRPLERLVVKELSGDDCKEYEAVLRAIRDTEQMPNGAARLKIIELVYWKRSHTLAGAGLAVGYSYEWAKRAQRRFIELVAENLELKEKSNHKSQKGVLK